MTQREEILSKLEELKGRLNGLSYSDKSEIEKLYRTVLRRQFTRTGCGDCFKDAVIEMFYYLKKNEIMQKSNYTLKAGVLLQMPGDPNAYSNANLTDEIAEVYLKDNSKRINFFEIYPSDWQDRIKEVQIKDRPKRRWGRPAQIQDVE